MNSNQTDKSNSTLIIPEIDYDDKRKNSIQTEPRDIHRDPTAQFQEKIKLLYSNVTNLFS